MLSAVIPVAAGMSNRLLSFFRSKEKDRRFVRNRGAPGNDGLNEEGYVNAVSSNSGGSRNVKSITVIFQE